MESKWFWALLLGLLLALPSSGATFPNTRPSTTNNDDTCEIATFPAATLLLPYFEVEADAPIGLARTTIFTVINTTSSAQIARATIWTDWGYPVLTFNMFLTGYDVQAINLYDVIARGLVAPPTGTSNASTPGRRSAPNNGNPYFRPDAGQTCAPGALPNALPPDLRADVQQALTNGTYSRCGTAKIGGPAFSPYPSASPRGARGYVTIDLVANCSSKGPYDAGYFEEILFDNVLTGHYAHISPNAATGNYAGGNPLVHIRAIPEGNLAGAAAETSLPYTFYDRLTPQAKMDRRQPLPTTFAAHYIQSGANAFNTDFHIWREPRTRPDAACSSYVDNRRMKYVEFIRFDERETVTSLAPSFTINFPPDLPALPVLSQLPSVSTEFPPLTSGDVAGWMYMNLNRDPAPARSSQNWVTVSLFAEGRYSVLMDATMLANGCTPAPPLADRVNNPIGPGPNETP